MESGSQTATLHVSGEHLRNEDRRLGKEILDMWNTEVELYGAVPACQCFASSDLHNRH